MDENNTKTQEHKLFNIIYRLDFNGFYTERLEALSAERAVKDTSVASGHSICSDSSSGSIPPSLTSLQPDSVRYVPGHYSLKKSSGSGSDR